MYQNLLKLSSFAAQSSYDNFPLISLVHDSLTHQKNVESILAQTIEKRAFAAIYCGRFGTFKNFKCIVDTLGKIDETCEDLGITLLQAVRTNFISSKPLLFFDTALDLLIDKGVDVNSTNNQGNTLIMTACKFSNYGQIDILLNYNPDLRIKNEEGNNAIGLLSDYRSSFRENDWNELSILDQLNIFPFIGDNSYLETNSYYQENQNKQQPVLKRLKGIIERLELF